MECERCGRGGGKPREETDPWGRVYGRPVECDGCWDREPPEPDMNAVSARERSELEHRAKYGRGGTHA